MMTVPNQRTAQLIDQEIGTPGRGALLSWLEDSLAMVKNDLLEVSEEKDLHVLRGYGQILLELTRGLRNGIRVPSGGAQPSPWTPDVA